MGVIMNFMLYADFKKKYIYLSIFFVLVGAWLSVAPFGYAQEQGTAGPVLGTVTLEATPSIELKTPRLVTSTTSLTSTVIPYSSDESVVEFSRLGFSEEILQGSTASARFRFGLPADWELMEGSELQLDLFVSSDGTNALTTTTILPSPDSTLQVEFNDVFLGTLVNQNGERTITIPITTSALR